MPRNVARRASDEDILEDDEDGYVHVTIRQADEACMVLPYAEENKGGIRASHHIVLVATISEVVFQILPSIA